MLKQILSSLIIILFPLLMCCSSFRDVTLDEIRTNNEKILEVKTAEGKTYNISSRGYEVKKDTIYVRFGLELLNDETSIPFKGNIGFNNIVCLKSREAGNNLSPFDLILIGVLAGILVLFAIHITK